MKGDLKVSISSPKIIPKIFVPEVIPKLENGFPNGVTSKLVTGTASSVAVPEGVYCTRVISAGSAETVKYQPVWKQFNQLWDYSTQDIEPGEIYTYRGVTFKRFSNEGIGYSITGKASSGQSILTSNTSGAPANHKLLVTGVPDGTSSSAYGFRIYAGGTKYVSKDGIYSYTSDTTYFRIFVTSGAEIDTEFVPQVYDLTAMFGDGNEPTMEEFKKLFPGTYAYDAGTDSTVEVSVGSTKLIPVCGGSFSFYDSSSESVSTDYTIEFIGRFD